MLPLDPFTACGPGRAGPDAKFGVPPDQIVEGYRRAKAAGATRFGMHMMTGSCVLNNDYWAETGEPAGRARRKPPHLSRLVFLPSHPPACACGRCFLQ